MTVRAKPWTLDSNSNTSSCDGTNNTINGWSGGNTNDFIEQLVDECGVLCEPCSGTEDSDGDGISDDCDNCHNLAGDINDDFIVDVLDIVFAVYEIINPSPPTPHDIVFQYKEIYNVDDHGATIGIESKSKDEGVQYLFNTSYHEDAIEVEQLQQSSSIRFYIPE